MLEITDRVSAVGDEEAAGAQDPTRCVAGLQSALQTMVEEGNPANASAAFTLLLTLEQHGPALDAQQFLAVYQSIDRAIGRSRAVPGAMYDSPDRVQWRTILQRSKECLIALTRAWGSASKDRGRGPARTPTEPSSATV